MTPSSREVYAKAYELDVLPPTFYKNYTVLICKNDNAEKLKSLDGYRHKFLCNEDYKIFKKVLARRLQIVITSLTHSHLTCGIRGGAFRRKSILLAQYLSAYPMVLSRLSAFKLFFLKHFTGLAILSFLLLWSHLGLGELCIEAYLCYKSGTIRLIITFDSLNLLPFDPPCGKVTPYHPFFSFCTLSPCALVFSEAVSSMVSPRQTMKSKCLSRWLFLFFCSQEMCFGCHDANKAILRRRSSWGEPWKTKRIWKGWCGTKPHQFRGITLDSETMQYLEVPVCQIRNSGPQWSSALTVVKRKTQAWMERELSMFARA